MSDATEAAERLLGNWYFAYGCTQEGLTEKCRADIAAVVQAVRDARPAAADAGWAERLAAALEFYADPCSYMWWINNPETKDTRKVLVDGGEKARAALAAAGDPAGRGRADEGEQT